MPTIQPFLDWYGIWAGQASIDDGQVWIQDMPVGVRLAVQPAQKSSVLITPERPWEEGGLTPQVVLRDDDVLKMWYIARGGGQGEPAFIAYAESSDGFTWNRPELGLQEYDGSTANNLLFDFGDFGLQSVFIDPSAPSEARYKAMARDSIVYHKGVVVRSLPATSPAIRAEATAASGPAPACSSSGTTCGGSPISPTSGRTGTSTTTSGGRAARPHPCTGPCGNRTGWSRSRRRKRGG